MLVLSYLVPIILVSLLEQNVSVAVCLRSVMVRLFGAGWDQGTLTVARQSLDSSTVTFLICEHFPTMT